jgi:two-component system phosphate regulon sensor histidine kinase PhoR
MSEELILVADDNPEMRQAIEETILNPAGYTVRSVGDGMSALSLAHELEPDVIITDHLMPSLTGIELIRRLNIEKPHIPVILITGEGSEDLAIEAMRSGASDYITKPFKAEQLLAAVGRVLSSSQRWKEMMRAEGEAIETEDDLGRRVLELETLAQIGRSVTVMLDLDEVLATVVESAVQLTGAEEGSLLLLDDVSGELYMRASKNFDDEFVRTFRVQVQDSLAGQVVETGKVVLLDARSPKKIKTAYLVHSLIYVPLQVRGRTIGVLGVDNRKAGLELDEHDATVMMAMADYAAIAIENAQLLNRSEAERRKLETILLQTENAVIVVDTDHRILVMNKAAQEAFNVQGDFIGRSVVEAIDDPKLLALIREPGISVKREEIEVSDGRIFNAVKSPIRGVGQAVVMHDISHLKELDRIKSEFVTTVSHDLRSPLTAILGYVELIERAGPTTSQQDEFISRIKLSVEQITNLVSDLLDLGRIEAGLDSTHEETPISVLARYAVESMRVPAEAKGLSMELDVDDDLPMVNGDPIRLRQMIGNLLENAVKYTPSGGQVCLEANSEDSQIILRVLDDGPGIPPSDQPYLFDKFYRASNIPADVPGTGLGLSIVKSIVDHHNGRIWVDSQMGEGTVFTVVLPALQT